MFIATIYMYRLTKPCMFGTCDPATIANVFPSYVLTLPQTPALSAADVLAIHHHDPHCSHLPLTSDGWFSFGEVPLNAEYVDRPASVAFERVIEMQIPGAHCCLCTSSSMPLHTVRYTPSRVFWPTELNSLPSSPAHVLCTCSQGKLLGCPAISWSDLQYS